MPSRSERLFAALAERGADAFISGDRPNQLYLLDHPDPSTVISRPNCAAVVFAASETVVFPGIWISNACRDMLENCEVVANEKGDSPPVEQLIERLAKVGYKKIITDNAGLAEAIGKGVAGTAVEVDDIARALRRTKDERDLAGMREAARVADLGMSTAFTVIRPGVTCGEVIAEGTSAMLKAGAESVAMAPAAGVGTYYLDSGGRANTGHGDGKLFLTVPKASNIADTFVYNPLDPVPSRGGAMLGPRAGVQRQNDVEGRDDVLVYTSPVLKEDVEVTGLVELVLHISTTAPSTDFTGKLVDVHPDGSAYYVSEGALRLKPGDLKPDGPTEISIDLWPTSMVFKEGHRIRLEVSSSSYPHFDRNPNTGRDIATETAPIASTQTVSHGTDYLSRLVLPVIPR